jgi:hypothetical protein
MAQYARRRALIIEDEIVIALGRLNSQRLRVRETQNKSPGTQVAGEPGLRGIGAGQRRGRLGGAAPIIETENGGANALVPCTFSFL